MTQTLAVKAPEQPRRHFPAWLRPNKIGAIYILVALVILFSLWKPTEFVSWLTVSQIFNTNAVTALMALALVVPLASGVFDLSIGYTMGLGSVLVAFFLGVVNLDPVTAILATLLLAGLVGALNGVVVVVFKIDSFVGTLATGSILAAMILLVSGNQQMTAGVDKIQALGYSSVLSISIPVFVALAVAVAIWILLEVLVVGRAIYATGLGLEQARLAGIRVNAIRFGSLLTSAVVAGMAGILVTSIIGAGSPSVGPPYLIPAFAAAFVGATQFRDGLFNAWGTVVAVLLLGTANEGLALANVPEWTAFVFNGLVLIAALGLRGLETRRTRKSA